MATTEEIQNAVRAFITENIPGSENLKNDSPLISSRIMDSIVALKLVSFLEDKFQVEFEAHEVDQDNLETIDIISAFVAKKQK